MKVFIRFNHNNMTLQSKIFSDYYHIRKYVTSAIMQMKKGDEVVICKLFEESEVK